MKQSKLFIFYVIIASCIISFWASCDKKRTNSAPAIYDRDSVPIMITYGVNTLISDSGIIKYRIIAEKNMYKDSYNAILPFIMTRNVAGSFMDMYKLLLQKM